MLAESRQRIFIIRDDTETSAGQLSEETRKLPILVLPHPRTSQPANYLLDEAAGRLLEVQVYEDGPRSWFIGSTVEPNGELYVCTPFDPLYTIIPYLAKCKGAQQLDDILTDADFPHLAKLPAVIPGSRLDLITDKKVVDDIVAYKYSEDRCLNWLEERVRPLAALLEAKGLHGTSGTADNYVKVDKHHVDSVVYQKFAWGILSEYLPGGVSAALRRRLALPEDKDPGGQETGAPPAAKRAKTQVQVTPDEDYSRTAAQPAKVLAPKNAKQRALAKSAVGTKSIMSFFGKK